MTGRPVQMLQREQFARAVEGALQQMEDNQAGQRRSGSLVSMHLLHKGRCPGLGRLLLFSDCLGLANYCHDRRALHPESEALPFQPFGVPRA